MLGLRGDFEKLHKQYEDYRTSKAVPTKIDQKLWFLAQSILKKPMSTDVLTLTERQQFERMDQSAQMQLFNAIASCIMGLSTPSTVKQAYIRKDRLLASWEPCYISYDRENLYLTRKSKQVIPLSTLLMSKNVRQKSSKHCFAIEIPGGRFYVGCNSEEEARNLLDALQKEAHHQEYIKSAILPEISEIPRSQSEISPVSSEETLQPHIVAQFNLDDLESENGYRVTESFSDGRILVHQQKPNTVKMLMVLHSRDVGNLLEMYCDQVRWNPIVESSVVLNRLDDNVFLVYEKYKQFDMTSRCRDALFIRTAVKRGTKVYLIEKSIDLKTHPETRSVVRKKINEKATAIIPHEHEASTMFIIRMDIDFSGLNTRDDNIKMATWMLKNIYNFKNYCSQKDISTEIPSSLFCFKRKDYGYVEVQEELSKEPDFLSQTNHNLVDFMQQYEDEPLDQVYLKLVIEQEQYLTLCLNVKHRQDVMRKGKQHVTEGNNNFIFQNGDWRMSEDREFVFQNQKVLDAQKDVLRYIVSKFCKNLIGGKSIVNMSMPVDIFQSRSLLQRNAGCFGYAPIWMNNAMETNDEVEHMKLISLMIMTQPLLELRSEKPFNPILGETFQGYIGGIPIYYEQISHHPPISAYLMKTNQWEIYGTVAPYVDIGLNSGVGGNAGVTHVILNGNHYHCVCQGGEVAGMIIGQRKFRAVGKGYVYEPNKMLYSEFSFGKDKKGVYQTSKKMSNSDVAGGIFKVTPEFIHKVQVEKQKHKFQGLTARDKFTMLCSIEGAWNDTISFNGKVYKTLFDPEPYMVQYEKFPLPSNSNFREDIIYKRLGDLAMAQNIKQKLQNLQRADKKLRHD